MIIILLFVKLDLILEYWVLVIMLLYKNLYYQLPIHLITKNVNPFKGLPAGMYCNIIDDCATSITVGSDGKAQVTINNYEEQK